MFKTLNMYFSTIPLYEGNQLLIIICIYISCRMRIIILIIALDY